jgi:hypothetical protein
MEKNNKNLIIAAIAIIIVIAIAIAIPHFKHAAPVAPTTAPVSATDTSGSSTDGSTVASLAAWNELFQKYDGRLVVFGADCNTTPHTQTQAKGTTILMMNNGNIPHTFTIGGVSYAVGAYHYKTFMLNTAGTVIINCDAHNGVAAIAVQ